MPNALLLILAICIPLTTAHAQGLSPEDMRSSPPVETPSATVPVTFLGAYAYRILVGRQFCAAPCVLDLKPGPAHLYVVGEGNYGRGGSLGSHFEEDVIIPSVPTTIDINTLYKAKKMVGITLLTTGILMTAGGAVELGLAQAQAVYAISAFKAIGITFIAVGALTGIIGAIVLSTDHSKRLELKPQQRAANSLQLSGLSLAASPDGGGAAVAFTF